jgi:5-methylcytosine-specific restriction endonuclease McrA
MNTNELVKWISELIETDELAKFYMSIEFRHLKKAILEENHWECEICKKEHGKITRATTVHHVQFVRKYPHLALSRYYTYNGKQYKNLIAVCPSCHNRLHPEKSKFKKKEQLNTEKW